MGGKGDTDLENKIDSSIKSNLNDYQNNNLNFNLLSEIETKYYDISEELSEFLVLINKYEKNSNLDTVDNLEIQSSKKRISEIELKWGEIQKNLV